MISQDFRADEKDEERNWEEKSAGKGKERKNEEEKEETSENEKNETKYRGEERVEKQQTNGVNILDN